MYCSRIFLAILLLSSIMILPSLVYASDSKKDPPLKQIDNGIPTEDIKCSNDLKLIYKASNKYPVCVKPQTAEKLIQRGWGIWQPVNYLVKTDGFLIPYNIIGGNMLGVKTDIQNKIVIFSVNITSSGVLYVKI